MIEVGDSIPDVQLPNHLGELISLKSYFGKKPLVIYFYPKNNTPGCTAEACSFRDHYEDFQSLGAEVIGISADTVESHRAVIKNRRLPFILLSDTNRLAEKAFKVPRNLFGMISGRVTFITDRQGIVIHTFNSATQPTKHVSTALDILKNQL